MQALRSEDDLKAARRALFEAFPDSAGCGELLEFQHRLIAEIRRSESERKEESSDVRDHLHRVRSYGDALAFECLSIYALRQLRRNQGKPPDISGQGGAFDLVTSCLEVLNQNGVKAIISDLTNVLKTGDIVGCVHPDIPQIFECKASPPKSNRFERQGRRGRQLSRMESILRFLVSGEGKFFMDDRYRRTMTVKSERKFNFSVVDEVVSRALAVRPLSLSLTNFRCTSPRRTESRTTRTRFMAGKSRPVNVFLWRALRNRLRAVGLMFRLRCCGTFRRPRVGRSWRVMSHCFMWSEPMHSLGSVGEMF